MRKMIFACDLDNTILYSYKHKQADDVCLEMRKGKEQGFTTRYAWELLQEVLQGEYYVPVTTRSLEQYRRIRWPQDRQPHYALTSNGSRLLVDGAVDESWKLDYAAWIEPQRAELERLAASVMERGEFIQAKLVDDSYLFAYCCAETDIRQSASDWQKRTTLEVRPSGRKLYFFPHRVDKGTAVRYLARRLGIDELAAAGDSCIDYPMLEAGSLALVPDQAAAAAISVRQIEICPSGSSFAEFVLGRAKALIC